MQPIAACTNVVLLVPCGVFSKRSASLGGSKFRGVTMLALACGLSAPPKLFRDVGEAQDLQQENSNATPATKDLHQAIGGGIPARIAGRSLNGFSDDAARGSHSI
jgi:hypothetical protein